VAPAQVQAPVKAHRHAVVKEMFEAALIDTDQKRIVGVKPYAEFVPLFRQTRMMERDWMFVLEGEDKKPLRIPRSLNG
jgi:hypothetical protein